MDTTAIGAALNAGFTAVVGDVVELATGVLPIALPVLALTVGVPLVIRFGKRLIK